MNTWQALRQVFCITLCKALLLVNISAAKKVSSKRAIKRKAAVAPVVEMKRSACPPASVNKAFDFCKPTDQLAGDNDHNVKAIIHGSLLVHEGPLVIHAADDVWDIDCCKDCGTGDVKKERKKLGDLTASCQGASGNEEQLTELQKSLVEIIPHNPCDLASAQSVMMSCDTAIDVPKTRPGSYRVVQGCICNFDPQRDVFLVKFDKGCLRAPGAMMDLVFQTVVEPNLSAWAAQGYLPTGVVLPYATQSCALKQLVHPALCKDSGDDVCASMMTGKSKKYVTPKSFVCSPDCSYQQVNRPKECLPQCSTNTPSPCYAGCSGAMQTNTPFAFSTKQSFSDSCLPYGYSGAGSAVCQNFAELVLEYRPVDCGRPEWVSFTFYPRQDFCVYGLKSEVTRADGPLTSAELAGEICYTPEQLAKCPRSFLKIRPGTLTYKLISSNMLDCFGSSNPTVVDVMKCDVDLACCLGSLGVDEDAFKQICDALQYAEAAAQDTKKVRNVGNSVAKYDNLFRQAVTSVEDSEKREKVYQAILRTYQRRTLDLSGES